jgi:hypothetical protein
MLCMLYFSRNHNDLARVKTKSMCTSHSWHLSNALRPPIVTSQENLAVNRRCDTDERDSKGYDVPSDQHERVLSRRREDLPV